MRIYHINNFLLTKDTDRTVNYILDESSVGDSLNIHTRIEYLTDDSITLRNKLNELTLEQTDELLKEALSYLKDNTYWNEIVAYDEAHGYTGLDRPYEPILTSDTKLYTIEKLSNYPINILYIAKNEIYARHGYVFQNKELMNYFLGQLWYTTDIFDIKSLTTEETKNLELIVRLLDGAS